MSQAPMKKQRHRRTRSAYRNRSVGLPEVYWTYLSKQADDGFDSVNRLVRIAVEEKYPEIKHIKPEEPRDGKGRR